jgi:DNA-binding beta-propeller fold protein YncE
VTPDGNFVMVGSSWSDDLVVFLRDPASGSLGWLAEFTNGVEGVEGLGDVSGIAAAPTSIGGAVATSSIHVTSWNGGRLARFLQGPPNESPAVSFAEATVLGTWPTDPAVRPDGTRLYVSDVYLNRIAALERDPVTGAVGALLGSVENGVGGATGLTQPRGLALSPDGSSLYATSSNDDTLVALRTPEPAAPLAVAAAALFLLRRRAARARSAR